MPPEFVHPKPRTILRVVGQNGGGGARLHVYQLNKALENTGIRTMTIIPAPTFVDPFTSSTLNGLDYRHSFTFQAIYEAARRLSPDRDLIHSHLRNADALCSLVSRFTRIRHLITVHTPLFRGRLSVRDRAYYHLLRRAFTKATAIIFISNFIRNLTLSQLNLRDSDIRAYTIYNSSDDPGCRIPSTASDKLNVCLVGELTDRKGFADFESIILTLHAKRSSHSMHFHVFGDGPWRQRLEELATKTGLLTVYGYRKDAETIYADKDINLMLGRDEAFGRTITEAKARGVPTVAYRAGAFPELVRDGVDGVLAENPNELLHRLMQLATQPADLLRMRQASRLDFERRFTVQRFAAENIAVLEEVAP